MYKLLIAITLAGFLGISTLFAQVDESRMERDIRIMQSVLNELFRETSGNRLERDWNTTESTNNRYVSGLGIMLEVPSTRIYTSKFMRQYRDDRDEDCENDTDNTFEPAKRTIQTFLKDYGDLAVELPDDEYVMVTYRPKSQTNEYYFNRDDEKTVQTILMKVSKRDIERFRANQISEEEFYDSIKTSTTNDDIAQTKEYKVFASILKSLYSSENDEGRFEPVIQGDEDNEEEMLYNFQQSRYYHKSGLRSAVPFEMISGYGVVYSLKLGYKLEGYNEVAFQNTLRLNGKTINGRLRNGQVIIIERDGDEVYKVEDSDSEDDEQDEEELQDLEENQIAYLQARDEKITAIYDNFMDEIRQNMIEYGRTLRSLDDQEWLILNVELPACYECDLPANLAFKVKSSVLADFDRGDIELEEAIDEIQLDESGLARELRDIPALMGDFKD